MVDPGARRPVADRGDRHGLRRSRHAASSSRRLTYGLYAQVCAAAGARGRRASTRRPGSRSTSDAVAAAAPRAARADRLDLRPEQPDRRPDRAAAAGRRSSTRCPTGLHRRCRRGLHGLRRPGACAPTGRPTSRDGRPVIVIRSFSKIFGLAGLRLGYARRRPAGRPPARRRAGAVQRQPRRAGRRPRRRRRARLRRAAPRGGRRGARGAARRAGRRRHRQPAVADQLRAGRAGHRRPPGLRAS